MSGKPDSSRSEGTESNVIPIGNRSIERVRASDFRTMLDVLRTSNAGADECDRCGGTLVKKHGGEIQYDGGIVDYVTWEPHSALWVVERRLCDCAIGVAMSKRGHGAGLPRVAHGRWFDVERDTAENWAYRRWEIENQQDRHDYYRETLEKMDRRGVDIDAEVARIREDHWGKDWWKRGPSPAWQNPAWVENLGPL